MSIKALLLDGIGSAMKYVVTDGLDIGSGPSNPWSPVSPAGGAWTPDTLASTIWTDMVPGTGTWTPVT